jgi:hypothetical protein
MWTGAAVKGIVAPRRYRYMRFAGLCVAIFGASIGVIHNGDVRWIIWALTALVALLLFVSGEHGFRRWMVDFEGHASPDQEALLDRLRMWDRFQVRYVLLSVVAFIAVLFIPVSPPARFGIWVILVFGLAFVLVKVTIRRTHDGGSANRRNRDS